MVEVFQPTDINDETTWLDACAPGAECWKVGEPTMCDIAQLNRNVCQRISNILQCSDGLKDLTLAGIGASDGESWESLLLELAKNQAINTLELNQISPQSPVLKQFPPNLRKLTLIDCALPTLFQLSDLPSCLTELRTIHCRIQPAHMQREWDSISALELWDLRGNPLNRELCVSLSGLLPRASTLQKLILEDTNMSDELLALLFAKQVRVRSLNLGENHLHDANSILRLMEIQATVSTLKLQGNPLSCYVPRAVLPNMTIRRLDLSSCYSGSVCRTNVLSSMCHLRALNLSGNSLDVTTIQTITSMTSLATLQLHNCRLTDIHCSTLLTQLSSQCSALDLENNSIRHVAPIAAWICRRHTKLTSLRLAGNSLTDGHMLSIALEEHCWTLVHTTGLPAVARHWVRLNRAGRSWLTTPHGGDGDKTERRLCEQLAEAERVYGLNGTYGLLRQVPHLVLQAAG